MKLEQVNIVRDAASKLIDIDPEQAFALFSLALEYRPGGPYISKMYYELKRRLGYKTFAVIGNCQAQIIANILKEKSDKFVIETVITAHLYKEHSDAIYNILDRVDYIITQNISGEFEGINTDTILNKYDKKVVRVLNLYFQGYHPDWCYLPTYQGKRCKSPIGDYHNRTVVESFIDGLSQEEARDRYLSHEYNSLKYNGIFDNSLNVLLAREEGVDIKMHDVISEKVKRNENVFHTFNHPAKSLLNIQVLRILDYLGINHEGISKSTNGDCLNNIILRKNPINNIDDMSELTFQGRTVDINKFIDDCYLIYSRNTDFINKYIEGRNLR